MKKINYTKTIQLIIFCALAAAEIFGIAADNGQNTGMTSLLLWLSLSFSFFFIFLDFNFYSKEEERYAKLVKDLSSDEMTKIGNRYSIDKLIDRYDNLPLPQNFVCVVLTLSNIRAINDQYGRPEGNAAIRSANASSEGTEETSLSRCLKTARRMRSAVLFRESGARSMKIMRMPAMFPWTLSME